MPTLSLGPTFSIDANIATKRVILLGQPDSGKTNSLTRIAEELLKIHVPIVIFDWKGDLWGLRSSADGQRDGFPIVIFGGEHADVTIAEREGAAIGELVAHDHLSALCDLSSFVTDRERRQFATAFLHAFLQAKSNDFTPHALLLDEYQELAPEKPLKSAPSDAGSQSKLLHATLKVCQLGRKRGIGVIGTTLRAAQLNKAALELSDLYLFMQSSGRNDLASIVRTIGKVATLEEVERIQSGVPRLQKGEVVVYSPSWLRVLEQHQFGLRETFDSSRTPEVGLDLSALTPTTFATIDVPSLRARIDATREQREQIDPDVLVARIASLERELRDAPERPATIAHSDCEMRNANLERENAALRRALSASRSQERPVLSDEERSALLQACGTIAALVAKTTASIGVTATADSASAPAADSPELPRPNRASATSADHGVIAASQRSQAGVPSAGAVPARTHVIPAHLRTTNAPGAIIASLASLPDGRATRRQLGALTGYAATKSTLRNALTTLLGKGLITVAGDTVSLTAAGRQAGGPPPAPKTTAETITMWRSLVKKRTPVSILNALVDAYPKPLSRSALALSTSLNTEVSTFRNALTELRAYGLIESYGSDLRASHDLFPTGPLTRGSLH